MPLTVDVIVIGAGLAGLSAAGVLCDAGVSFAVVERSPTLGGRAVHATLRVGEIATPVDIGAQFFTVSDPRLETQVRRWRDEGVVSSWDGDFGRYGPAGFERRQSLHPRYVCPGGMGGLAASLVQGLPSTSLILGREALALLPSETGAKVALLSDGLELSARVIILAIPAPEALALTDALPASPLRAALGDVRFDPCWAVAYPTANRPRLPWVGVEVTDPAIAWAALDDTRRQAGPPVLVLTARADWTRARRTRPASEALAELSEAARTLFGRWAAPSGPGLAVLWPNARPAVLHPDAYAASDGIIACGDWCQSEAHSVTQTVSTRGPRVETAILSGWAAANLALRSL